MRRNKLFPHNLPTLAEDNRIFPVFHFIIVDEFPLFYDLFPCLQFALYIHFNQNGRVFCLFLIAHFLSIAWLLVRALHWYTITRCVHCAKIQQHITCSHIKKYSIIFCIFRLPSKINLLWTQRGMVLLSANCDVMTSLHPPCAPPPCVYFSQALRHFILNSCDKTIGLSGMEKQYCAICGKCLAATSWPPK